MTNCSIACLGLFVAALNCGAVEEHAAFGNDGIDRTDPNFVQVSLLIACMNRICLHLK